MMDDPLEATEVRSTLFYAPPGLEQPLPIIFSNLRYLKSNRWWSVPTRQ